MTRRAAASREWIATNAARERDVLYRPANPAGGPFDLRRPSGANVAPWVGRALTGTLPASDRTAAR